MLAHLLTVVLAQASAAAPPDPAPMDIGWLFQALGPVSFFSVLGLLWKVAQWHTETGERLKSLEAIVVGDGKGSEGCALRHRALDAQIREAPSKGSVADAFEQLRALEARAAEDRQSNAVALARIESTLQALVDKLDALADGPRPIGRQRTNPGFDPAKGR